MAGHRGTGSVSLTQTPAGEYRADRLTLIHKGEDAGSVAVSTHRAATSRRFIEIAVIADLAKMTAAPLARSGRTAAYRRNTADTKAELRADPGWRDHRIVVDGEPATFRIISTGRCWAALGRRGDIFLQVTAAGFRPGQVTLVPITDLSPYLG
jgi:hypothetical protein